MKLKTLLAATALTMTALVAPAAAFASPADAAVARSCTHTSSGSCIRGGQFCPASMKNKSGWDAAGRRYVCKGGSHPHWMKP